MKTWLIAVCAFTVVPALAQHLEHGNHQEAHSRTHNPPGQSSYAGMQSRSIKALSAQQIADLRAGKGMGLALPAELNGYPGPLHTLEMAEALELSKEQKLKIADLYKEMQMEAKSGGEAVIAGEDELDRLFKEKKATLLTVQKASAKAAHAQGILRAIHLKYHLATVEILNSAQVAKYNQLRGYQ
jgi:hypothetical protein